MAIKYFNKYLCYVSEKRAVVYFALILHFPDELESDGNPLAVHRHRRFDVWISSSKQCTVQLFVTRLQEV